MVAQMLNRLLLRLIVRLENAPPVILPSLGTSGVECERCPVAQSRTIANACPSRQHQTDRRRFEVAACDLYCNRAPHVEAFGIDRGRAAARIPATEDPGEPT